MTAQCHRWQQPHCQTEAGNANGDYTYEPSKHCPRPLRQGGESSVYQLAWEGNMQQLRSWKLKKRKLRLLINFGFLRAEIVLQRKRSPSTDSRFEAIFALSLLVLSFALGYFFPGLPLFPFHGTIRCHNYHRNIRSMYTQTYIKSSLLSLFYWS